MTRGGGAGNDPVRFLEPADVLAAAGELQDGRLDALGEVDLAALAAALMRVYEARPGDYAEAAALVFVELARARAFPSGNRAVAWLAACQLISLNGGELPAGDPGHLQALLADVTAGADVEALADWIRARCLPAGRSERKGVMMFERFSDEARDVLVHAREEARDLGHDLLGTEHLLLGILAQDDGVAARALGRAGVTRLAVRDAVRKMIGSTPSPALHRAPRFTPRTKKVLELSLREAVRARCRRIGPEHVLLGLIAEGTGVAAKVMENTGVDLKALQRELRAGGLSGRLQAPQPRLEGIDLGAYRQRMLGDLDALTGRIRDLEAECERLRGILRRHGIEPDGGERSA